MGFILVLILILIKIYYIDICLLILTIIKYLIINKFICKIKKRLIYLIIYLYDKLDTKKKVLNTKKIFIEVDLTLLILIITEIFNYILIKKFITL